MLSFFFACNGNTISIDGTTNEDFAECSTDEGLETYSRYIEPLMTDAHSASCNECHLPGVDLGMFVRDTPCESMACLIDQNLVDLDDPEASAILSFVSQGESVSDLMSDETRAAEYTGFLEWIEFHSVCYDEVCGDIDDPCGEGSAGNTIDPSIETPIGGCSEDELAEVFDAKVWKWHGRCWTCHYIDGEAQPDFPSSPSWYTTTPKGTMFNVIGAGYIDVENPEQSRLVTKPLQEGLSVDSELGEFTGEWHGGGDKFKADGDTFNDEAFYDHVDFIAYYLDCLEQ